MSQAEEALESGDEEALETLSPALAEVSPLAGGSIELQPNVIRGVVRLTNRNPDILALLARDGWNTAVITATSTSPRGFSARATPTYLAPGRNELAFELLVEASAGGAAGVTYDLGATRQASDPQRYFFPVLKGVNVKPRDVQPEPTNVSIESCVGAVQFKMGTDDTCTTPVNVASFSVQGLSTFKSTDSHTYTGYVNQSGTPVVWRLTYGVSVPGGIVTVFRDVERAASCDELVTICTPVATGTAPGLGALKGPWALVGEPSVRRWTVRADDRSDRTASFSSPGAPVGDPSSWWTLSNLFEGSRSLKSSFSLKSGREFSTMDMTSSPTVSDVVTSVTAGKTTTVTKVVDGETRYPFVMRPSYFYGSVRLANPSIPLRPGSFSSLQKLFFNGNYDSNRDGIPDNTDLANRSTALSAYVTGGGSALGTVWTGFPGDFDPATGELASTYEQVLASPYDRARTWRQNYLSLRFWSEGAAINTRPGLYDPERFRYGQLTLSQPERREALLNAGDRHRIDHEYCFNEVQVQYDTTLGRLYNPVAQVSGSFTGTDWRGLASRYTASGTFYGTPAVWSQPNAASYAQTSGSVSMTLPQGSYTLTPSASMVKEDGTVNSATFAPIGFTLGCGQVVKLVPPLAVLVSTEAYCASGNAVPVTGVVRSSPAQVDRIWYRVNGGPEITYCTNCGIDPDFKFTAPLSACDNTVQVFAYTEGMP
ncbi:MAG TPA: hypothetical protein VEU33_50060 [Archangium sp.]|nr:hypothetical protein [Archangium sp.]